MSFHSILALTAAVFVLAATPGPGVFATISRALSSGFRSAAVMVAGIVLGDLIFLVFSIYGLVAVARLMGNFFLAVKYAGGLYLIWLGCRIFFEKPDPEGVRIKTSASGKAGFLSGLAITLGNPKVIMFYLGFLPTFMPLDSLTLPDVLIAVLIISGVLGGVLLAYAWTAARGRQFLTAPKARTLMNRGSGSVMMATGTYLMTKN